MQRKTVFYQRFVNWIKVSVIIDFSTEHNFKTFINVDKYAARAIIVFLHAVINKTMTEEVMIKIVCLISANVTV